MIWGTKGRFCGGFGSLEAVLAAIEDFDLCISRLRLGVIEGWRERQDCLAIFAHLQFGRALVFGTRTETNIQPAAMYLNVERWRLCDDAAGVAVPNGKTLVADLYLSLAFIAGCATALRCPRQRQISTSQVRAGFRWGRLRFRLPDSAL